MLENEDRMLWLTPHTAVVRAHGRVAKSWMQLNRSRRFCFSVDGKDIAALARSPEHFLEICDVVLRLLAVSVVHSVTLHSWGSVQALLPLSHFGVSDGAMPKSEGIIILRSRNGGKSLPCAWRLFKAGSRYRNEQL
jgi:hypothetical protein